MLHQLSSVHVDLCNLAINRITLTEQRWQNTPANNCCGIPFHLWETNNPQRRKVSTAMKDRNVYLHCVTIGRHWLREDPVQGSCNFPCVLDQSKSIIPSLYALIVWWVGARCWNHRDTNKICSAFLVWWYHHLEAFSIGFSECCLAHASCSTVRKHHFCIKPSSCMIILAAPWI